MRYRYITKIEIKFDKKKTFKRKSIKYLQKIIFQESVKLPGVHFGEVTGTPEEIAALDASYVHLQKMRDEIISLGIIPPVEEWSKINPNL